MHQEGNGIVYEKKKNQEKKTVELQQMETNNLVRFLPFLKIKRLYLEKVTEYSFH